jgi:hypothetical protein
VAKHKSKAKRDPHAEKPRSEREAIVYEVDLNKYIAKHDGRYVRADDGSLHLIVEDLRIPLAFDRKNHGLAKLMLDACDVTSLSPGAQAAIQRLQVRAQRSASGLSIRHFAALSADRRRLYIPVHGSKLLKITAESIDCASNGQNVDGFWVEHPEVYGGVPAFKYQSKSPADGLKKFEKLAVETQSCRVSAMRWLVAMHEGLFPFVREICRARLLLIHIGGTQQGKTTAAQRFTQLLGLGEVKGDYSVAALANQPDIGLLVMDNKEQANFTQPLIDFCLFLATGAQRGRSTTEGKQRPQATTRPVGVITSIEGAWKPELQARCMEVAYAINGTTTDRDNIEDQILEHRDVILSAMVPVLQLWLRVQGTKQPWNVCPRPEFERHLCTLAELLWAYGEIAEKPEGWAEMIIAEWERQISQTNGDAEVEDDLEYPIREILTAQTRDDPIRAETITFEDQPGTLYVTETGALLALLRRHCQPDVGLPKNSTGLGRRLRSARFRVLRFLDHESAPQLAQLKRTTSKRPIGFFIPNDSDGKAWNL